MEEESRETFPGDRRRFFFFCLVVIPLNSDQTERRSGARGKCVEQGGISELKCAPREPPLG